jgi:hypothetical protein
MPYSSGGTYQMLVQADLGSTRGTVITVWMKVRDGMGREDDSLYLPIPLQKVLLR